MPNNLLEGLTNLTGTILQQAGAIAQIRADAAKEKAKAEIGLMNARFLADINSFKINPENYEQAFSDHRAALDSYANQLDFAPARDAVKASANSLIPELYYQGAMAMNKQQLVSAFADWKKGFLAIGQDTSKTAQERLLSQEEAIDKAKSLNLGDPIALEDLRASAKSTARIGSAQESIDSILQKEGIEKALETVGSIDWIKKSGLERDEARVIESDLWNRQKVADDKMIGEAEKLMADKIDSYIAPSEWTAILNTKNASKETKAKVKELLYNHNYGELSNRYNEKISGAKWWDEKGYDYLKTLRDRIQADFRTVAGEDEEFIGVKQEELKTYLLNRIEGKMADYENTEKRKAAADDDVSRRNLAMLSEAFRAKKENRKDFFNTPEMGEYLNYKEGDFLLDALVQLKNGGNEAATAFSSFMEEMFPDKSKQLTQDLTRMSSWAMSYDEIKDDPDKWNKASEYLAAMSAAAEDSNEDLYNKNRYSLFSMLTGKDYGVTGVQNREMGGVDKDFAKVAEWAYGDKPGFFTVSTDGSRVPLAANKADYEALKQYEQSSLVSRYGFDKKNISITMDDDIKSRTFGIAGKTYKYNWTNGKMELFDISGSSPVRVDTIEEKAAKDKAAEAEAARIAAENAASAELAKYPRPEKYNGGTPWEKLDLQKRKDYYDALNKNAKTAQANTSIRGERKTEIDELINASNIAEDTIDDAITVLNTSGKLKTPEEVAYYLDALKIRDKVELKEVRRPGGTLSAWSRK